MKVYNTLSGKKEEFAPHPSQVKDEVKIYVCGVTPYDDAHIGHAMSYVIFDVIRRYLRFRGYKVKYVQNVTDIDDKIIDRANQRDIPPAELAQKYADSYFEDMDALNIERADIYPKATEEIPKIIEVIAGLIDKGFAYPAGGSVYFRVRKDPDYGKLSHRSLDAMMSGECAIGGEEKEDPMDFALWKASKPGEPWWQSPWGQGRPGWHIECSAMSLKYLGEQIDIHGGGQDLIFPHHENENAQSESFTGKKPFVKYWLHNGLVQLGEEKMSKSLGNLITIKQALTKYSPDAIRIFILSSHYRSPLTYSEEGLEAAEKGVERLRGAVSRDDPGGGKVFDAEPYRKQFIEAMDDDFNTAQALAALFDLAREINRADEANADATEARQTLKELGGILGLTLTPQKEPFEARLYNEFLTLYERKNLSEAVDCIRAISTALDSNEASYNRLLTSIRNKLVHGQYPDLDTLVTNTKFYTEILTSIRNQLVHTVHPKDFQGMRDNLKALYISAIKNVDAYISIRNHLRQDKQFQLADEIRSKLRELEIALEDTPKGTMWKPAGMHFFNVATNLCRRFVIGYEEELDNFYLKGETLLDKAVVSCRIFDSKGKFLYGLERNNLTSETPPKYRFMLTKEGWHKVTDDAGNELFRIVARMDEDDNIVTYIFGTFFDKDGKLAAEGNTRGLTVNSSLKMG